MAEVSNQTLIASIPRDTPALLGDERAMIQILNNLLSNAIKFASDNGRINVSVFMGESNGIGLAITDTGIGMLEEGIVKALRPFEQVDSKHAHRRHDGTGLGLHLCANLMKLFGGTMDIESEVDSGTTVTLNFPPERTICLV